MSDIKPFRAYRPRPDVVAQVASPPYDVLTSDEARALAAGQPLSFLHVVKPEIDLEPGVHPYDGRVYTTGAENLRRLIDQGILVREAAPALYVYQQVMGDHVQAGVVGGASVREYDSNLIKKHEHTRPDKEDDRTRHVDTVNANTGPVFLTYRARPAIDALVDDVRRGTPLYDFEAGDGIRHTVWAVTDGGAIGRFAAAFAAVPAAYVADGHHRSASAARIGRQRREANPHHTGDEVYNHFLAAFFPHDQLRILAYNRVIRDLGTHTPASFRQALAARFTVAATDTPAPERAASFGMYLDGRWYRLEARPDTYPEDDPVRSLDASILQENLIAPLLGIEDPRRDARLDFVGGIRSPAELERRVNAGWALAFTLHPTTIEQLMRVADAGLVMPPKSTWFEPKLRSGLLVRPLS